MWGVLFGGGDWAVCLHSINEGQWVVGGGGWLYTLATTDDACKVEKITLFLSLLTEDLFIRMGRTYSYKDLAFFHWKFTFYFYTPSVNVINK